jgi:hypothetical protein
VGWSERREGLELKGWEQPSTLIRVPSTGADFNSKVQQQSTAHECSVGAPLTVAILARSPVAGRRPSRVAVVTLSSVSQRPFSKWNWSKEGPPAISGGLGVGEGCGVWGRGKVSGGV